MLWHDKYLSNSHHDISNNELLRERLQHVYWIGGGSGAGKSTIARRLADQHGFRVYETDEMMADHGRRSTPEDAPLLHRFVAMSMDERWVDRSPEAMLDTFPWFHGECFNLIVEDLLSLPPAGALRVPGVVTPPEPGVIVEGFRLLPRLVRPLLSVITHAVWLLPTPVFRESVIESRGGAAWRFLARTSDPATALSNLLERDRMFTEILREETARLGLPAIDVDATAAEDDLAQRVAELFGL